jgi:cell division protease FtsH
MATSLARSMVMEWGMSERLGRVRYRSNEQEVFLGHSVAQSTNISDETAKIIDEEVRKLIEEGESEARRLITENRDKFIAIAEGLLEYETLSGEEIKNLLDGKPPIRDTGDDVPPSRPSVVPTTRGPRPKGDPGLEPQPQS